jgi:hypothetical protein
VCTVRENVIATDGNNNITPNIGDISAKGEEESSSKVISSEEYPIAYEIYMFESANLATCTAISKHQGIERVK